jgi:hypothetical protein
MWIRGLTRSEYPNKFGEFLEQLNDYQLLTKKSASWSWFVRYGT